MTQHKIAGMISSFVTCLAIFVGYSLMNGGVEKSKEKEPEYSIPVLPVPPAPVQPIVPPPTETDLVGVQVPIIKSNRIYNKTGIQCVWCTCESLSRHHGITRGFDFTDKYKSYANPTNVANACRIRNIRVKQTTGNKEAGYRFLKEYVQDKKLGCGVGVNGTHMITCVHFDEKAGVVKVIDNMGPKALQVQTWTMSYFKSRFDGWSFVILPDNYKEAVSDSKWTATVDDPGFLYGKN